MRQKKVPKRLLAWMLSFLFLLAYTPSVFAFDFSGLFKGPDPMLTPPEPALKMMTPTQKVYAPLNGRNLFSSGNITELSPLYDRDIATVGGSETPVTVTLDLGSLHRVSGVRFLPAGDSPNRCVGTKFSVSKNNKTFIPAGSIEPIHGGDYPADWQEITFGSGDTVRYVRAELPAGASFYEIEWLSYADWSYMGKTLYFGLYAFDIQETFDGTVMTAIYNKNGVLKQIFNHPQTFTKDTPVHFTMEIPGLQRQAGDSYRILVFKADGTPVLNQPLKYYDNDGSPALSMPNLFSDHMLLQAEQPLTIWGNAPTGSKVWVSLENVNGGKVEKETTPRQGHWEVNLGSFSPGGNYRLTVQCGSERKRFYNLTFGDVWLLVGQSNMDYFMLGGNDTASYLDSDPHIDNPNIRLLNLWNLGIGGTGGVVGNLPLAYGQTAWAPMNRDTANYCSAVGYFIAQDLEQTYHNPIGLLSVAVGDTEINRWIPYGDTYGSFTSTDGGLFHNRVAPFAKLQIKGILMYQGEADQYRTFLTTNEYRDAMAGLVNRYREIWGADIPFYWAQLTRYKKDESAVREGQRLALSRIANPKNAGIISLIDVYGEYEAGTGNCREDIHPHQKQVVADRFLRYIKRDIYGEEIAVTGPVYQSMEIVDNAIELTFQTTGDLTVLPVSQYADKAGQVFIEENQIDTTIPQEFEIAGSDGVFVRATAKIQGNKIILSNSQVPEPKMARYAWGAYPETPNLTDASGLPALSFATHLY